MQAVFDRTVYYVTNFWDYFRVVIDVLLVALIFYWIYRFFANTRAMQLVKGLVAIIIVALLSHFLRLDTLNWLITTVGSYVVIAVIILFQPELRRLLTQFGQRNWIANTLATDTFPLDELVNAVFAMSEERIGSLLVLERNISLRSYIESGVAINSGITEELIRTIFFPNTALHDGAIIIQEARIAAAACYLPLSDSRQLKKQHGARHRAALGMAEETDALVIVTSEETGGISLMVNGRMHSKIKIPDLKNMILFFMNPKTAYEERYSIK